MSDKKVLLLGGCGFIGRHILKDLIENKIVSFVRVADKRPPQTTYQGKDFEKYYVDNKLVEFKQCDLSNPKHMDKAFGGTKFDWVVNLAAETRYGQEDAVYQKMILDLSLNCAAEADKMGVEKYIEFSTAHGFYSSSKKATEKDTPKPWTLLGKYKHQVEEDIKKKFPKLNVIFLRPAIVYGPGDMLGLLPRIICAATYVHTEGEMKLLWTSDMKINTVHVQDVSNATIHLLKNGKVGSVFNLCDKFDTTQGKFNSILEQIYGIKTSYFGSILSNLASLNLEGAAKTANDNHMSPWSEMTQKDGIKFTPLSPYLDKELLSNNPVNIDGTAIESTGFKYSFPDITKKHVEEEIQYFVDQKVFPVVGSLKK